MLFQRQGLENLVLKLKGSLKPVSTQLKIYNYEH
jgi:hypothetical protein